MKRLYRSEKDRMIAGICGGLGEYFKIDPTIIRIGWVVVTFLTALVPMVLAYLILILFIPKQSKVKNG